MLESWLGYRKMTTALADIYMHLIGPPRSGMTDVVPAATEVTWVPPPRDARPTSGPSKEGRARVPTAPARNPIPQEDDEEHDARPATWRRRWWRRDEGAEDEEEPVPDLEEQRTTRFVEADA